MTPDIEWDRLIFGIFVVVCGLLFLFHRRFADFAFGTDPRGALWNMLGPRTGQIVAAALCILIGGYVIYLGVIPGHGN